MKQFKHIPTGDVVEEVEGNSGYYKDIWIPYNPYICGKYIIGCRDWEEIKENT